MSAPEWIAAAHRAASHCGVSDSVEDVLAREILERLPMPEIESIIEAAILERGFAVPALTTAQVARQAAASASGLIVTRLSKGDIDTMTDRQSYIDAMEACDDCGAPRVCEVTAEDLTDEHVKIVRRRAMDGSPLAESCTYADAPDRGTGRDDLDASGDEEREARIEDARERVAAAYNALPDASRRLTLAERIRWLARNGS